MPRAGLLACLTTLVVAACRSAPELPEPVVLAVTPAVLEAGEGFSSRLLFTSDLVSAHATTVEGALRPHLHRDHEETVYVLSGTARMRIGDRWYELAPGDLVHVPRGVVHEVVTEEPAAVLSLFAPPFRGLDRVFVDGEPSGAGPGPGARTREGAWRGGEGRARAAFVLPRGLLESRRDPRSGL